MKRISSLLCLIALLLHLIVPFSTVYATETGDPGGTADIFTVTTSSTVNSGNTIVVTVTATNVVPLLAAMLTPEYDRSIFELTEFTFRIEGILTDFNGEDGVILLDPPTVPNGVLAEFTLTAKADASIGSYTVGCRVIARDSNDEVVEFPVKDVPVAITCSHISDLPENKATCQKQAVCDICGVSYGDVADHDFSAEMSKDATGHWYDCQTVSCTEKDGFAEHIPDHEGGATEEYAVTCIVCQYVIEEQLVENELLGDINGDNAVDIEDALLLFQHSMLPDMFPIEYKGNIDFTKDGFVDIDDAMLLFQHSMLPNLFPIS